MLLYNKAILEDRKNRLDRSRNGGRGDWIALAKFIIVVAVIFSAVGIILHRHNQVKQQLVELNTSILELQRANRELEHRAQNRYTELERLRSTDIAERARSLGLRPAKNSQIVRDIRLVWEDGTLRPQGPTVAGR
ncbi:MAG: hypothetical protein IKR13_05700 [Victivallales bacterium]|nr:hypothetical protein [Victivallales bacterium]